jgi:hypothetical protein
MPQKRAGRASKRAASTDDLPKRFCGYSDAAGAALVLGTRLSADVIPLTQHNIPTLYVAYRDVLARPVEAANRLNVFLGGSLDAHAMGYAVDSALYRQCRAQSGARGLLV